MIDRIVLILPVVLLLAGCLGVDGAPLVRNDAPLWGPADLCL